MLYFGIKCDCAGACILGIEPLEYKKTHMRAGSTTTLTGRVREFAGRRPRGLRNKYEPTENRDYGLFFGWSPVHAIFGVLLVKCNELVGAAICLGQSYYIFGVS